MFTPQSPNQATGVNPNIGPQAMPNRAPVFLEATTGKLHRQAERLLNLEDLQQAYTDLGHIALGANIEDATNPHELASGVVTRAIHKRREREIARDAVTRQHFIPPVEQLQEGREFVDQFMERKRDKAADAAQEALVRGMSTRAVLMERKATIIKPDSERLVVGGEYMRPMSHGEKSAARKAAKAAYKSGAISRVEYNQERIDIDTREVLDLPNDPITKVESKAPGKVSKWESAIHSKTESGIAATVRKARINRLRKKVDKRTGGRGVVRTPVVQPIAPANVTPPVPNAVHIGGATPEKMRTPFLTQILDRSAVAASGWVTRGQSGYEIPNNLRTGSSLPQVDDFKELGESQALRVSAGFERTDPAVLQKFLEAGYSDLVTVVKFDSKDGLNMPLGQVKPNSEKAHEPLIRITYETTNRGTNDPTTVNKYPYDVETKHNAEFRMHLFLAQSDADGLLNAIKAEPTIMREVVDIAMRRELKASENWDHRGLRPPYEQWARQNAVDVGLNPDTHPINRMALREIDHVPLPNGHKMRDILRFAYNALGPDDPNNFKDLSWYS
jgi:hypothetical protein